MDFGGSAQVAMMQVGRAIRREECLLAVLAGEKTDAKEEASCCGVVLRVVVTQEGQTVCKITCRRR